MTNNQSNELRESFVKAFEHAGLYPYDDDTAAQLLGELTQAAFVHIQDRERQARIQAIDDVKKAGYGYDDGTGFVLKISYTELAQLIGDK